MSHLLGARQWRVLRAAVALGSAVLCAVGPGTARAFEWRGKALAIEAGLRSESYVDRRIAVAALRGMDREPALRFVGQVLVEEADPRIVALAIGVAADRVLHETGARVVALATDPRPDVRRAALAALPILGDAAEGRAKLRRSLADVHPEVRIAGARSLIVAEGREAIPAVLPLFDDAAEAVRIAAVRLLGRFRDPILLRPLLERLADLSAEVRKEAVVALGLVGDPAAVGPLLGTLADDDPGVRLAIVRALGELGDPKALRALAAIITGSATGQLKLRAATALGEIGHPDAIEPLLFALRFSDSATRATVARALARIGFPAVAPISRQLLSELSAADASRSRDTIDGLAEALGRIGGPDATSFLVELLRSVRGGGGGVPPRPDLRVPILETLTRIADPEALLTILGQLTDVDPEVRLAAVEAVRPIADERAVEPLIERVRSDPSARVVKAAIGVLGAVGSRGAAPALIEATRRADPGAVAAAAASLGLVGDPRGVAPLLGLLASSDPGVRRAAATALVNLGDPRAIEPVIAHIRVPGALGKPAAIRALGALLRGAAERPVRIVDLVSGLLHSGDPSLTVSAAEALGAMGAVEAVPALLHRYRRAALDVKRKLLEVLGQLGGKDALAALREALDSADARSRATAVWFLGKLADERSTAALVFALADPDESVRINAAYAVAVLGAGEAERTLRPIAGGDPNRYARANACLALGLVGSVEVVAELVGCSQDPEPIVRASAIRGLAELLERLGAKEEEGAAVDQARGAVRRLADEDASPANKRLARSALGRELPRWRAVPRRSWVAIAPGGLEGEPLPGVRVVLVFGSGEVRATATDLHGEIRAEHVAEGGVRWSLPGLVPVE